RSRVETRRRQEYPRDRRSFHPPPGGRQRFARERFRRTRGKPRDQNGAGVASISAVPLGAQPAARAPPLSALWAIALAGVAAAGSTVVLALASEGVPDPVARAITVDWVMLPYIFAGLVARSRRPESRFGPLLVAAGFAAFLSHLSWTSLAL